MKKKIISHPGVTYRNTKEEPVKKGERENADLTEVKSLTTNIKSKHPEYFKNEYTRSDMLNVLLSFEKEIISRLPENNGKITKLFDVENHIRKMAREKGIIDDVHFEKNMTELSQMFKTLQRYICSLKVGMNGEKAVRHELNLVNSNDMDVEVLSNVALSVGDYSCEIDHICITNYGIYCIEVKNPSTDMMIDNHGYYVPVDIQDVKREKKNNIVHQSRVRQHVIKQYVGTDKPVYSFVVCGNWDKTIDLQYDSSYIESLRMDEIVGRIEKDAKEKALLYDEYDIEEIKYSICAAKFDLKIQCPVDIEKLLGKYEYILNRLRSKKCVKTLTEVSDGPSEYEYQINDEKSSDKDSYGQVIPLMFKIIGELLSQPHPATS